MPIVLLDQYSNLVDDYQNVLNPNMVFALNIEGDHEGGFASRVIKELEIEKFDKVGPGKAGEAILVPGPHQENWWGIRCYSLGHLGWDFAKPALLEGLEQIRQQRGWDATQGWYEIQPMVVQLPGGDKVGRLTGADPMETLSAFAEHPHTKSMIYNG